MMVGAVDRRQLQLWIKNPLAVASISLESVSGNIPKCPNKLVSMVGDGTNIDIPQLNLTHFQKAFFLLWEPRRQVVITKILRF